MIKLLKKKKKKFLEAAREKWNFTFRKTTIWMTMNFSFETIENIKMWHNIFQMLKEKKCHLWILHPAKNILQKWRRNKGILKFKKRDSLSKKTYPWKIPERGNWVIHSVEHRTSAQVMISRFLSLSPTLGSLLSAWSLLRISVPLSASLSLKNE